MRASAREPLEHRLTSRVRASQAGTGAIDVSDLALLLRASSVSCSPAEVLIVAISIDRDGSGSIDWAEYRDWLKADPHRFQGLHRRLAPLASADPDSAGDRPGHESLLLHGLANKLRLQSISTFHQDQYE